MTPTVPDVGSAECVGVLGRWLGHKYEPRFDETKSRNGGFSNIKYKGDGTGFESVFPVDRTTYVHDVCTRCGDVIGRGEQ